MGQTTIDSYISIHLIKNWKYSHMCTTTEEFIELCGIPIHEDDIGIEEFLINVEFIANLLNLIIRQKPHYLDLIEIIDEILKNINFILDKYNFKIQELEQEKVIIVPKSEIISEIAVLNEDVAPQIIEYGANSIKGDVNRKKELILRIAHKYEGIEQKLKNNNNNELVRILGTLLNNLDLRHNNVVGKKSNEFVKNLSDEELENWYDRTYDTLLYALMTNTYIENKKEIFSLNELLTPSANN